MQGPLVSQSDEQLLARARLEDRAALGELLTRHHPRLLGLCRAMIGQSLADDVCQDAMVSIIRGLPNFAGQAAFSTWATRIAINACHAKRRSEKIRSGGGPQIAQPQIALQTWELPRPQRIQQSGQGMALARAVDALADEFRTVLILRDVHGLEYEELGDVLGLPVGTIKSRLFRARSALRAALDKDGSEVNSTRPDLT